MLLHRHGAALKKNIPNLARVVPSGKITTEATNEVEDEKHSNMRINTKSSHAIKFSEVVDIETVMMTPFAEGRTHHDNDINGDKGIKFCTIYAKPTSISLKDIYETYGWSQIVTFIVGGFPITPAGKS